MYTFPTPLIKMSLSRQLINTPHQHVSLTECADCSSKQPSQSMFHQRGGRKTKLRTLINFVCLFQRCVCFHVVIRLFPRCLIRLFPRCLIRLFPRCLIRLFPRCLIRLFPRCLVRLFPRCLIRLFPRCLILICLFPRCLSLFPRCLIRPQKPSGLLGMGSPGQPPQLSHSS